MIKLKKEYDELVARAPAVDGKNADVKQEEAVAGVKEESSSDGSIVVKEAARGGIKCKSSMFRSFFD